MQDEDAQNLSRGQLDRETITRLDVTRERLRERTKGLAGRARGPVLFYFFVWIEFGEFNVFLLSLAQRITGACTDAYFAIAQSFISLALFRLAARSCRIRLW